MKKYNFLLILVLLFTACVGKNNTKTKPNGNITDSKVKYLTADGLDILSKSCYTTNHYYDPTDKIHVFINDNGVIGGDIMSQDSPNSKDCVFHPYIWDNKEFKTISFANSELSRCDEVSKCFLQVSGIGNNGYLLGNVFTFGIEDMSGYGIFYYDGNLHAYARGKYNIASEKPIVFSPNIEHILSLTYYPDSYGDHALLDYNIYKNNFTSIINHFHTDYDPQLQIINDDGYFLYTNHGTNSYRAITTVGHVNDKSVATISDDQYSLEINTLSNNGEYSYGVTYVVNGSSINDKLFHTLLRLEPLNNNKLTTITNLPFDTTNSSLVNIQVTNDGILLFSVDHYRKVQLKETVSSIIDNKNFYLYSSETGKFYKFDDVLTALDLSKYIGRYNMTTAPIKFSPNGHYMVLDVHNIEPNEIAVKVNFAEGIGKFLQENLTPIN